MPEFVKSNPNAVLASPKEPEKPPVDVDDTERKTLYDQLKESKGMYISKLYLWTILTLEQKQLEFEQKFQVQNATYKLDDKSAKFYAELSRKKKEKEELKKQEDERELDRFRKLQKEKPKEEEKRNLKPITIKRKQKEPSEPEKAKKPKPEPQDTILSGYSSEDED